MKNLVPSAICIIICASLSSGKPVNDNKMAEYISPEDRLRQIKESEIFVVKPEGYLYQSDMMFTAEQAMKILQRKMLKNLEDLWPRNHNNELNINYVYADDRVSREIVQQSISEWEEKTCVKFTHLPFPPEDNSEHLKFADAKYCWSYIGNTKNGPDGGHTVSVASECDLSTTIHEIGHAMGFHHEQSRSDRDSYVKILIDNSKPDGRGQFSIESTNNFETSYDYYSTMHYGTMFFSNGKITIRTMDPMAQSVIGGDSRALSFMDAKMFNKAYNCIGDWENSCPDFAGRCLNGGYVKTDFSGTCSCTCPEGTEGTYCEIYLMDYTAGVIQKHFPFTERIVHEGVVSSPNYPSLADEFTFFTKYIQAPEGQHVLLKFDDLQMSSQYEDGVCNTESLEVRLHEDDLDSGEILCGGKEWQFREFISHSNVLILNYYSRNGGTKGFTATITFV